MSYIPRVTQLDAGHLDDQLVELIKQQILDATRFLEPGLLQRLLPELELILRSWIFKYSVYDKKTTFGQQMLSLRYCEDNFSKSKLFWYFVYSVGLKYLKERAVYSFTDKTRLQNFIMSLETLYSICDVLNFLRFIKSGKYPTVRDYILGLKMSADKITREDLTDLAWTRELLWNNFIELIGTIISLMNIFGLKGHLQGLMKYAWWRKPATAITPLGPPVMTVNTVCGICSCNPVIPHVMGCSHVFCFYCITANKSADKDFPCPHCNYNGSEVTKFVVIS